MGTGEGGSGGKGYTHDYDGFSLLYSRNQHNQSNFPPIKKEKKKKTNVDFLCHIPDVQIRIYILTLSPDGCVCILKFETHWINDITYIKHLIQCWHVVNTQQILLVIVFAIIIIAIFILNHLGPVYHLRT